MSNLIPFDFNSIPVRVVTDEHGEPLFVGKDVCAALGFTNPNKAMNDHCKGVTIRYPLKTAGGHQEFRVLIESDVLRLIINCKLPAAVEFERLVFEEILPSIRRTGKYDINGASASMPDKKADALATTFCATLRLAEMVGLDGNQRILSANQATFVLTGTDVLALLNAPALVSPVQEQLVTPTDIPDWLSLRLK